MVTINALVFQSVPALALFGLIATYMLAAQILWLFVLMLLGVLFLMLASHRLEWGRARASLETGYALRTVFASGAMAGLLAFLATPILALTIGRAISTVVVGMPLRGNFRTTPSETPPELQAGVGAVSLSDMEVLRLRIEGNAQPNYLRMESYNIYTGRGWNRGRVFYEEMLPLGQGKFAPQRVPDAPEQHQVTATVTLSTGWHRILYAPGYPLEVEAPVRQLQFVRWVGAVASYRPLGAGVAGDGLRAAHGVRVWGVGGAAGVSGDADSCADHRARHLDGGGWDAAAREFPHDAVRDAARTAGRRRRGQPQ